MKRIFHALALLGTVAGLTPAAAQVFTPTFQAPRSSSDVGIYLSEGPGDFAVEGILRRGFGGYDLGLRGGIADTEDVSILIGGDLRNPLAVGTAPIDLAFTAGIQALLGDATGVGLQAGLSLGHTFAPAGAGFSFTPYIHPRVGLVDSWRRDGDFDADLMADLGFDLGFATGLALRFGVQLGDPPGGGDWGIGLAWR